jgi:hypothetical protein
MPGSKSVRRGLSGLVAIALVVVIGLGCGISLNRVALPLAPADAPKAWKPLLDCAQELGYRHQDVTKDANSPRVVVYTTSNDMFEITYQTSQGQFEMILKIWAKTTDEDREKIFAKMRKQGDQIWACAEQKMNAAPAAASSGGPAPSASTGATPPP